MKIYEWTQVIEKEEKTQEENNNEIKSFLENKRLLKCVKWKKKKLYTDMETLFEKQMSEKQKINIEMRKRI